MTIELANSTFHSTSQPLFIQALSWVHARLSIWSALVIGLLTLCLYDQILYLQKKGKIAGPSFKIWPIIGPFLESVNPNFEEYKAKWASGPLSCVSVFHKFVVIASVRDLARKTFNSPQYVRPCVVDIAVKILRPTSWVFKDGKEHIDFRKSLNGLFTRNALRIYLPIMEQLHDNYLERFVSTSKDAPRTFMTDFREINCAISLRTFCGNYISEDQIKQIADQYYLVTEAMELVNFPVILPFTKPWYGKKAADAAMAVFEKCAALSKKYVADGGESTCLLDSWVQLMLDSEDETGKKRTKLFSDKEISETLFTFLFASQDATSSATTWLFQMLADRPEIREKVREEQLRVREGDLNRALDLDLVENMTYTQMVVKELLRYRPPVIMVPYVAKRAYPITENYTVPKGAMVIPTTYPALHDPEVYENPDEFIPERWVPGGKAEEAKKNWLVFGAGPHVCIGQTYVMMNLTSLIGKASLFYDWTHTVTELSETIRVFATIFPDDECILQFRKRSVEEIMGKA